MMVHWVAPSRLSLNDGREDRMPVIWPYCFCTDEKQTLFQPMPKWTGTVNDWMNDGWLYLFQNISWKVRAVFSPDRLQHQFYLNLQHLQIYW